MNFTRIAELKSILNGLYGVLKKLKERKAKLENEVCNAIDAQERLEYAVSSAKNRVEALGTLGMRPDFLEAILNPIRNRPDCSGLGTTVKTAISKAEAEIRETENQIWVADREKQQLEMEEV